MTSGLDHRGDVRREVNREFRSVDEFVMEYVTNLSRSGVFIRSEQPLPVGTQVNLRFTVIDSDLEVLEGIGEVVRVVPASPGVQAGMGVVFVELTSYSKQLIEKILVRK